MFHVKHSGGVRGVYVSRETFFERVVKNAERAVFCGSVPMWRMRLPSVQYRFAWSDVFHAGIVCRKQRVFAH